MIFLIITYYIFINLKIWVAPYIFYPRPLRSTISDVLENARMIKKQFNL